MKIKATQARPGFEKVRLRVGFSFYAIDGESNAFRSPWHFHREIELTYIISSSGRRMVGNSVEPFAEGDLVLLGPEVPHLYTTLSSGVRARAIVIQFLPNLISEKMGDLPEFAQIRQLLKKSGRGLSFPVETTRTLDADLRMLPKLRGVPALLSLLKILHHLSQEKHFRPLATEDYAPVIDRGAESRLSKVYAYATNHFSETITMPQLASVASMTPSAFSRYFKRTAGRNPSDFLSDLRIEQATRLLRETNDKVTDIASRVGFSTLTSFNRSFKERTHMTPRDYRASIIAFSPRQTLKPENLGKKM